jgi:putative NAD(P)-binding protein/integrase-like protein
MASRETRFEKLRRLGVGRPITRRDFIDRIAVTAAVAASPRALPAGDSERTAAAPQDSPDYNPPALTGMRGDHPGSFEAAHALRDGRFPNAGTSPIDTGENYDLIVVGGGISGLAAAYFYGVKAGPAARILILDNHDDFGGHAKRNEFELDGKTQLTLTWCSNGGVPSIGAVQPVHVATWIEAGTRELAAPSVKQRLAAIRRLFDWLVTGQVVPVNPAASMRGPRHVVTSGQTPVLDPTEARALLDSIDVTTHAGLRDRALIGLMVYSFARIGAALGMTVEDVFTQNRRLWVRLREKGGKRPQHRLWWAAERSRSSRLALRALRRPTISSMKRR